MANLDSRYIEGKIKGHIRSNFSNQNYAALSYEKIEDYVLKEYQEKDLAEAEEKFGKVFEELEQKDDIKNIQRRLDIYVLAGQDVAIGEKDYNLGFWSFILAVLFVAVNSKYHLISSDVGPFEALATFAIIYVVLSSIKPYLENPNLKLFVKNYKISILTLIAVLVALFIIYFSEPSILAIAIFGGTSIFYLARKWEEKTRKRRI